MGTSDYTLCLDDDVQLPPRLLTWLVRDLASEPGAFMATGYPFDIPPAHPSLLSYAVLSYHLPLVIGFSLSRKTSFVWGGCMLFRSPALRSDSAGLLKVRRDMRRKKACWDEALRWTVREARHGFWRLPPGPRLHVHAPLPS